MVQFRALLKRLLPAAVLGILSVSSAVANEWSAILDNVDEMIEKDGALYVRDRDTWHRLTFSDNALRREDTGAPHSLPRDQERMPDGYAVQVRAVTGLRKAWYAKPTDDYAHGVLGDGLEAHALRAEDVAGRLYEVVLPIDQVFEDRTPRLADLDGDGDVEIICIRSGLHNGAQVAVYELRDGRLIEMTITPPLGRTHRWLNIAGIADFDGDGVMDIAAVERPHMEGTLRFWRYMPGQMRLAGEKRGFSNHQAGERAMQLSTMVREGGTLHLVLPSFDRRTLVAVGLEDGEVKVFWRNAVPDEVVNGVAHLPSPWGHVYFVGTSDGRLLMEMIKR